MAYIIDESTGHSEVLLNETGKGTASSSWATVSKTIETNGDYRVVFVSGVRSDKEVTFENGTFEDGSAGDTTIPGWQTFTQQLRLGGVDSVAGQPTPDDTQFPASVAGAAPHDGAAPSSANYAAKLANNSSDGSGLSVQLQSTAVTVPSYGILHGPYLVSKDAISLKPGDSVSFDWQATGGSDAYDVIGYLVDEKTGQTQELINQTGDSPSASTNWATVTQTVKTEGSYKFVFVAGTWDASGGRAAGANLYIDNVVVDTSEQIVQADAALRVDEIVVTKKDQNLDKDELTKLFDRLYGFEEDVGRSYGVQFVGNRIEIDSNPIVSELESVSSIDVRSAAGANSALTILDQALAYSADSQADLSAVSRAVDYRMERLLDSSLQMEGAKSRIIDADYALESALLSKQQMLQQMASFVLTNTNELLRSTLNLLRQ
jgi:flagellin-like hook-associated protein FlgL